VACSGTAPTESGSTAAPASEVKAQVEAAVRKHLAKRSDLDMSAMELTIEQLEVQGETANAQVGFRVKDTPEAAMSMDYRLVKEAGEWVHGADPPPSGPGQGLPPGHPPTGESPSAQPLPPGHPPVAQ
jgi:hypothetical protein